MSAPTHTRRPPHSARPDRTARARSLRATALSIGLSAVALAAGALAGCTTDQVFDTSRYWGDRVTGATLDADPSRD